MSHSQSLIVSKNALQHIDLQSIVIRIDAAKVRLAANFTSKKDIRVHMNYVHIAPGDGVGALCVACDGHKLIVVHDESARAETSAVIPIGLGRIPAEMKAPNILCVDRDGLVFIQNPDLETIWVHPMPVMEDMKSLPYRDVIPPFSTWQPGGKEIVDVVVAKAMMKLDELDKKSADIRFYHSDKSQALLFASHSASAIGIVMGLRESAEHKMLLSEKFSALGIKTLAETAEAETGAPA